MNGLGRRIAAEIRERGPITVERYWTLALFDPRSGYYARRDPFGRAGDFTTAPEISQMFGELLGAWMLAAWHGLGRPAPVVFAEIGPGRGTAMADMLRTVRRLDAAFLKAATVRLVETSDRLAAEQLERLARFDLPVVRVRRLEELEPGPLLLVANELFDALPIRPLVFDGAAWRERLVGLSGEGELAFATGESMRRVPAALARLAPPAAGDVFEFSPARDALAAALGARLARGGGAALVVDYGHIGSGYGDTLQAIHRHAFADPLADPGEHDVTSHVDFERLAHVLAEAGLQLAPVTEQGDFLLSLGLSERAAALGRGTDERGRADVAAAVRRLAGKDEGEMGRLFKVLAAASARLDLPPFLRA